MNTIPSPEKGDSGKEWSLTEEIQENRYSFQNEINITDGGEFLDDALRMKDQPLGETTVKKNE